MFDFDKIQLTQLSICSYICIQSNHELQGSVIHLLCNKVRKSKHMCACVFAFVCSVWSIFLITINYSFDSVYVQYRRLK